MLTPEIPSGAQRSVRQRGSNQVGVRQYNERVVLQVLRAHGALSKAELARLTGLTAQTIGVITARLEEDALLRRDAPLRGKVGQPSVPLALNPDGAFSVGIKIGRRSTDCLLVDFTGAVRDRITIDYPFPDTHALLPAVRHNLEKLLATLGPLRSRAVGVGVAAPFQLGGWHRMLGLTEAESRAWNKMDLGAAVQALTELPVSFAKDTTAACVAELLQGRGREARSFLYLFVDTFVGGGLVIDSHLHRGRNGNAGAVASLPLEVTPAHGPVPEQLLTQASLWDLEQEFRTRGLDPLAAYDARSLQEPFATSTHAWTASAARALAHCIVSATALLDLEAVVVDGAMERTVLDELIAQTALALGSYNWEGLFDAPRLERGTVGAQARALGGALLPLHANFAPEHSVVLKED